MIFDTGITIETGKPLEYVKPPISIFQFIAESGLAEAIVGALRKSSQDGHKRTANRYGKSFATLPKDGGK